MVICAYIHDQNGMLCCRCLLQIRLERNVAESDVYMCLVLGKENEASAANILFNELKTNKIWNNFNFRLLTIASFVSLTGLRCKNVDVLCSDLPCLFRSMAKTTVDKIPFVGSISSIGGLRDNDTEIIPKKTNGEKHGTVTSEVSLFYRVLLQFSRCCHRC